jgi:hypothetical protein
MPGGTMLSLPSSPATPPSTTSDAISTSPSNEETARAHSIKKHQLRALSRQSLNVKVPEDAVKRAIELYDLEKSFDLQPEEVMDKVEQILGIEGLQWPTPHYRRMMILQKLSHSLKRVLTSYGHVFFTLICY